MGTGKYKLIDILDNSRLEHFLIPEIQRDYVWTAENVKDLLCYIKEGYAGEEEAPYLGFIYGYIDRDYHGRCFLVDGQQRMTTIFLVLLACYHRLEKKLPAHLVKQGMPKLDYKVRQATHDFLIALVDHCRPGNPHDFKISDQVWFYNEYRNDRTIKSIEQNFDTIRKWLSEEVGDNLTGFLGFMEQKVMLSYFDIQDGRQGEDLYIYMNSRGKHLQPNETLKAKYLSQITDENTKQQCGMSWERWQDFFWKHRGNKEGANADAGYNAFLVMIQIIWMCKKKETPGYAVSMFARSGDAAQFDSLPTEFSDLEKYFNALEWVVNSSAVASFFEKYEKSGHYIAHSHTIDASDKQKFFLQVLPALVLIAETGCRSEDAILRFIRFFYNVSRKKLTVGKDIGSIMPAAIKMMFTYCNDLDGEPEVCDLLSYVKGNTVLINDEEQLKLGLYTDPPKDITRDRLEQLFWRVEDHPVFGGEIDLLLGRYYDAGKRTLCIEHWENTLAVFESIFTGSEEIENLVTTALLYYGNTWKRSTPQYYQNYNCQDWYSLVRSGTEGKYLLDLLEDMHGKQPSYLHTIIKEKARQYFLEKNLASVKEVKQIRGEVFEQVKALAAIDYYTEQRLWKSGKCIAVHDEKFSAEDDDPKFFGGRVIFNVGQYINSGYYGRIMTDMKDVLKPSKADKVIERILNPG